MSIKSIMTHLKMNINSVDNNSNNNNNNIEKSKRLFSDTMIQRKIPSIRNNEKSTHTAENVKKYKPDFLFAVAYYNRYILDIFLNFAQNCSKTPAYRIIFKTTQPAHLITSIAIILVSAVFFSTNKPTAGIPEHKPISLRFTYLIYLTALSLHVGSQFWMTFVSGLSLYFNLARHAFGDVQRILFPKYFTLNCMLSAIILIQFGRLHSRLISEFDLHTTLQVVVLALCFVLELLIRLYVVPPVLKLISIKTDIEKSAGVGQEVGHYELGPLVSCPHYMSIHKAFRRVHMCTAIGNIISMMCSAFHLYYVANKWTEHLNL